MNKSHCQKNKKNCCGVMVFRIHTYKTRANQKILTLTVSPFYGLEAGLSP